MPAMHSMQLQKEVKSNPKKTTQLWKKCVAMKKAIVKWNLRWRPRNGLMVG